VQNCANADEDDILNSSVVFSEGEILTEFQAACEVEAEEPGQHTERVNRAAENLCGMLFFNREV